MAEDKKINMTAMFNLPPEKAVEYLKSLGFIITRDWKDLLNQSQKQAFTIAGVMREDILKDAKDIVTKGVEEGKTFESIKKEFSARMQAKGWHASNYRLKTIYRINSDIAYSVGRYEEQEAVKDFIPYWQYSAIMDMNTRPAHAYMNGKVFKATDPIWRYWYPPNGFNCRCTVRAMTKRRFEEKGLNLEDSAGKLKDASVEIGGKKYPTKAYGKAKIDVGWDKNFARENAKG